MTDPDDLVLISVQEAAKLIGLPPRAIYRMLRNGTIEGAKLNRTWLIERAVMDEMVMQGERTRQVIMGGREQQAPAPTPRDPLDSAIATINRSDPLAGLKRNLRKAQNKKFRDVLEKARSRRIAPAASEATARQDQD